MPAPGAGVSRVSRGARRPSPAAAGGATRVHPDASAASGRGAGGPALQRFPALDGLRGLAVLAVVVFHAFHASAPAAPGLVDKVVNRLAQSGWIGVDLFFVLSGFLITRILYATRAAPDRARSFYTRRFLRIFPLYYAFLAAVFLLAPPLSADPARFRAALGAPAWSWLYLTNVAVALHG